MDRIGQNHNLGTRKLSIGYYHWTMGGSQLQSNLGIILMYGYRSGHPRVIVSGRRQSGVGMGYDHMVGVVVEVGAAVWSCGRVVVL